MSDSRVFVATDGDRIGRVVGTMRLANDIEGVRRVSNLIERGNKLITSWAERYAGELIEEGGDEVAVAVPPRALPELVAIVEQYHAGVGATLSVGVGPSLAEASKALFVAKLRGGDQILAWAPEMEKELAEHPEPTGEEKLREEYGEGLGKASWDRAAAAQAGKLAGEATKARLKLVAERERRPVKSGQVVYQTSHTGERFHSQITSNEIKMLRVDGGMRDAPHVHIKPIGRPDSGTNTGWYPLHALHYEGEDEDLGKAELACAGCDAKHEGGAKGRAAASKAGWHVFSKEPKCPKCKLSKADDGKFNAPDAPPSKYTTQTGKGTATTDVLAMVRDAREGKLEGHPVKKGDEPAEAPATQPPASLEEGFRAVAQQHITAKNKVKEDAAKDADNLRTKLGEVLRGIQTKSKELQALGQHAPGAVAALTEMLGAVRDYARTLPPSRKAEPMAKAVPKLSFIEGGGDQADSVAHTAHLKVPEHAQAGAAEFDHMQRAQEIHAPTHDDPGGNSPKAVFRAPSGNHYLVKPYHEDGTPFHAGWSEMTNQALYHAGGIGHLHQTVHTRMMEGRNGEQHPAVVVHMDPSKVRATDFRGQLTQQAKEDAGKINVMDSLVANHDRHGGNVMVSEDGNQVMAIDHGHAFAGGHAGPWGELWQVPTQEKRAWAMSDAPATNAAYSPAGLKFWQEHRDDIMREFGNHVKLLTDPTQQNTVRTAVMRNAARLDSHVKLAAQNAINARARLGLANTDMSDDTLLSELQEKPGQGKWGEGDPAEAQTAPGRPGQKPGLTSVVNRIAERAKNAPGAQWKVPKSFDDPEPPEAL